MADIFEDGDSDIEIRTDNEYAKKYDTWRKKEELHKLETKYGKDVLENSDSEPSESSSDEDEDAELLTEDIQNKFFNTLMLLRSDDPIIYDKSVYFFDNKDQEEQKPVSKNKTKPLPNATLFTKDIVDSGSDDESDSENEQSEAAAEEVTQFVNLFDQKEDDLSSEEENDKVAEQKLPVKDKKDKKEKLPKGKGSATEDKNYQFIMDYILNKRYVFKKNEDEASSSQKNEQNDVSEDETDFEKQQEFEYKYNFRFEEPDKEFIKRYPRAIPNSLRIPDDSRKLKRNATKERKQKEKEEKLQELKKMQELKRSEIEEKIKKLKGVTGTTEVEFEGEDVDGDFDPETHDRRMQALFNDDFYEGEELQKKPEFPELDEYLEIENWDNWNGENDEAEEVEEADEANDDVTHCEDEDFNMDCDYDPRSVSAKKKEMLEKFKGKKNRKRKSLFARVLSESKPLFDPNDKTYEEYLDEYYKFDCEDLIGDLPCRFKYRKVVPNSFGLSVEEILSAKDKELNKWCPITKTLQRRPDHVEKYDQIAFEKKRHNVELTMRLLPSLFGESSGENSKSDKSGEPKESKVEEKVVNQKKKKSAQTAGSDDDGIEETNKEVDNATTSTSKKRKKKNKKTAQIAGNTSDGDDKIKEVDNATTTSTLKKRKKKKKNSRKSSITGNANETKQPDLDSKEEEAAEEVSKKKENQKIKKPKTRTNIDEQQGEHSRKRKFSDAGLQDKKGSAVNKKRKGNNKAAVKGKKKSIDVGMSDARLSAYGLNPKKFKNKLLYGNTNTQK